MSNATISAILTGGAAMLLSLILAYAPGAKDWFAKQTSQFKALFNAILVLIVAIAVGTFGCAGVFAEVAIECSKSGIETLLVTLFSVIVGMAGSQGMYMIAVRPFKSAE